jgi:hypothetical protein
MKTAITFLTLALSLGLTAQTELTFPMPSFVEMPSGDVLRSIQTSGDDLTERVEKIIVKPQQGDVFCYTVYYQNNTPVSYQKCTVTDSLNKPIKAMYRFSIDGKVLYNHAEEELFDMKQEVEGVLSWANQFSAYIDFMATRRENMNPSASN